MKGRKMPNKLSLVPSESLAFLHSATIEILSKKGVSFENQEAIDLLLDVGAAFNNDNRITIPETLVQQAINSAPSNIQIYDRNGSKAMDLGNNHAYCGTGSDCLFVLDSEAGRRSTLKKDIEVFTRLSDSLSNIDFVLSMGIATDVPTPTADLHHFQAMVLNTTKPIVFTIVEPRNLPLIIEIANKITGQALKERPFLLHYAMPSPPLKHSKIALQNVIHCARYSIPVIYASGTQLGVSGPMTVAGGVVSANADVLAGLVVHQLANPGTPFIYGVGVALLDMKTTVDSYGAPEGLSGNMINAQLAAQHYELPTWGYAACTDSKVLDLQAALEYMNSTLTGLLSHCHMLHDVGYLESGLTASCESIVLGNEVVEIARRILQPFEVSEETIPIDLLQEIGPNQTFLKTDHTLRHLRDFYYSPLIDRNRYQPWHEKGQKTMTDRLKSRVQEILAGHQPVVLEEEIALEISNLIRKEDEKSHEGKTSQNTNP
ncbi:MAG: trimethylamine methyltransferase family protein [Candidatus Hodarchaeales archaeon]|jgi:trimethylamine--corrinoid protein Co-methyltransferase